MKKIKQYNLEDFFKLELTEFYHVNYESNNPPATNIHLVFNCEINNKNLPSEKKQIKENKNIYLKSQELKKVNPEQRSSKILLKNKETKSKT